MAGYWVRHRLLPTILMSAAIALVTSFLFVYPSIQRQANDYNAQSIYKNSGIDFIAPEPSFNQTSDLPGTHGIDKVFPFFLTKTRINVNGTQRTTTVLLSDQLQNFDITMYSKSRLIERADTEYDNPVIADWQFCHDTGAKIGDTLSLTMGEENIEFRISAVYETNSIYDGGAVLAEISEAQKETIARQSDNNGYSGMYISAGDYNTCRSYLTTEYRPLGRLKDRDRFSDNDQYQVHYDAIMSSGYANEITDFRVRGDGLDKGSNSLMIWIGAILAIVVIVGFNMIMSRRGCEKVYFKKHCIPKGQSVKPYYILVFASESIFSIILYVAFMLFKLKMSKEFIPDTAVGIKIVILPLAVIIAEVICLVMNYSMLSEMTRKVDVEMKSTK